VNGRQSGRHGRPDHFAPSNNTNDTDDANTSRSTSTESQTTTSLSFGEKPNGQEFRCPSTFSFREKEYYRERNITKEKSQTKGFVPAINARDCSNPEINTSSSGNLCKMRLKKDVDSDNVVTTTTASTVQNSSSSSECHDANQTTTAATTTTSSGSGGDEDAFVMNGGLKDDIATANEKGNPKEIRDGKERSNHDRQKKPKEPMDQTKLRDGLPPRKKIRPYEEVSGQHHGSWGCRESINRPSADDDGSSLQVPGDDGSDKIVAADIEGGVPIKPATVVASRLFTHHTASPKRNSSALTMGAGMLHELESQKGAQTQHQLLLPPHREPGYHTIRNTLYRFHSSDSTSNSNGNCHRSNRGKKRRRGGTADESPTGEITKGHVSKKILTCNHRHHGRGDRSSGSSSNTSDPNTKHKRSKKKSRPNRGATTYDDDEAINVKYSHTAPPDQSLLQVRSTGGSSSGSGTDGTEDGYAGSVSSNENGSGNHQRGSSSPSPSVTSSEECEREKEGVRHKSKRRRNDSNAKRKTSDDPDSSSEIADFSSSGSSETVDEEDVGEERQSGNNRGFVLKTYSSPTSSSPSLSSSNFTDSEGLEMTYLSAKRHADAEHERMLKMFARKRKPRTSEISKNAKKLSSPQSKTSTRFIAKKLEDGRPPILAMGCDIMAHILTFLLPPEILDVLTMPLSKCWRKNFTSQPELWRVLCLVEPFKVNSNDPSTASSSDDDQKTTKKVPGDLCDEERYYPISKAGKHLLDKYRLLYTSFVRCMKYITQIRDDAINGRSPAYIDYGISGTAIGGAPDSYQFDNPNEETNRNSSSPPPPAAVGSNRSLQLFLAQARDVVLNSSNQENTSAGGEMKADDMTESVRNVPMLTAVARVGTGHRKTDNRRKNEKEEKKQGPKFGRSMITSRLFSPVPGGEQRNLNLPWSCAIYSIVNWMVAFCDVEGIQILCLKVLPVLLENEQHRLTAQHAGLADVVLRDMVMFSESSELHIAAFHTIVLLARPHGGREGMMFRTSMTADGIFRGIYQQDGKSGIAVMLDSMRRFQDNATLSAMSCWALVNIALVSDQKAVLVKLGGIQAITNAMYRHPFSAELQFRALFALINLVIPSAQKVESNGSDNSHNNPDNGNRNGDENSSATAVPLAPGLGELNETTEREIIDELVGDIASLVVRVMKNFCSSEAILNRACLVLHNLSLTDDYHVILLWTPHCYQMLEWCIANFRTDQVLQQSATGTLHRLQSTLAANKVMRLKFTKSLRTQQQHMTLRRTRNESH